MDRKRQRETSPQPSSPARASSLPPFSNPDELVEEALDEAIIDNYLLDDDDEGEDLFGDNVDQ